MIYGVRIFLRSGRSGGSEVVNIAEKQMKEEAMEDQMEETKKNIGI